MIGILLIAVMVPGSVFAASPDGLSEMRARLAAGVEATVGASETLRAREGSGDAPAAIREYLATAEHLENEVRAAKEAYQAEVTTLSRQANEAVAEDPRKAEDLTGRMQRLVQEMLSLTVRPTLFSTAARLDAVRLVNMLAQSRPMPERDFEMRAENLRRVKETLDETIASIIHPDNRLLLAPYTAEAYRQLGYWGLLRPDVKIAREAFAQAYLHKASEEIRHAVEALNKLPGTRSPPEREQVLTQIAVAGLTADSPGSTILLTAVHGTKGLR